MKNHPWSVIGHFANESRTILIETSTFRGCTLGAGDFDAQMSGIKFWKGDGNLRPVYKKSFLVRRKYTLTLLWDKCPTPPPPPQKKLCPKNRFFWHLTNFPIGKTVFWLKVFLGALFTKINITFLKSLYSISYIWRKRVFMDRTLNTFWELKGQKCKKPLNISKNCFLKQVLDFHRPS